MTVSYRPPLASQFGSRPPGKQRSDLRDRQLRSFSFDLAFSDIFELTADDAKRTIGLCSATTSVALAEDAYSLAASKLYRRHAPNSKFTIFRGPANVYDTKTFLLEVGAVSFERNIMSRKPTNTCEALKPIMAKAFAIPTGMPTAMRDLLKQIESASHGERALPERIDAVRVLSAAEAQNSEN